MKHLTTIFLLMCFHFQMKAQWISADSLSGIEVDSINYDDWNHIVDFGSTYLYCGLPSGNDSIMFKYHKLENTSDLIYFERTSIKENSFIQGFYRLTTSEFSDKKVLCWVPDLFWNYYNLSKELKFQEFFSMGDKVTPQTTIFKSTNNNIDDF